MKNLCLLVTGMLKSYVNNMMPTSTVLLSKSYITRQENYLKLQNKIDLQHFAYKIQSTNQIFICCTPLIIIQANYFITDNVTNQNNCITKEFVNLWIKNPLQKKIQKMDKNTRAWKLNENTRKASTIGGVGNIQWLKNRIITLDPQCTENIYTSPSSQN